MIKIGVIGEDPNDTTAIQNLLRPKLGAIANFKTICKNIRGCHLDSPKFYKTVGAETKSTSYDILICIRDLDAFKSESAKVLERQNWHKKIKDAANGCSTVLLLNIWELEAIIFADLIPFNKRYGVSLSFAGDPSSLKDPKERLKSETRKAKRKYVESDCKELFSELDFDKVTSRCAFFKDFLEDLRSRHKSFKAVI
ncbi:DUF4276 family protein [Sphingobacterium paucimobilis]|uniref:DUF4276 family protein n=1 Tax=Sphingobacterium paucimobilis HER1398 TaxID=1346330 RepID=U2HUY9_9SPHI|nr:DUF4276 family protein [Sphingobacterium paucimobilis]ERJ59342.1 hypothetical protein M472_11215 [Sphingobacterium paucimobilis HER1398]